MFGYWPAGVPLGWFALWPAPQRPSGRPAAGVPTGCDRALALARHPSFTPQAAARIARDLDGGDLRCVWSCSADLLRNPASAERRWAYVVLRAAVLDEMEARDAALFARWYADAIALPRSGRRRRSRSLRRLRVR